MRHVFALAALSTLMSWPAAAQTIYPIDRAEIVSGSRFDLKVEFPGKVAGDAIKVTINGEDASKALGKQPEIIPAEEGLDQTAYWIRGASLNAGGRYAVAASAGDAPVNVTWDVFDTPKRRAKNVILFIGDGMSVEQRTAAHSK